MSFVIKLQQNLSLFWQNVFFPYLNPTSYLNLPKSTIKTRTEVTLNLSSNIIGDSNDEDNFSHKLLLTNTHVSKLRKAFTNNSSANIKSLKTQLHKIIQSGGFLGLLLGPLPKKEIYLNHWLKAFKYQ